MGLLEPGDDDEKGAGTPRRRKSMKIDDIMCDLKKSSGCGPTMNTTKIPNIDCIPSGKVYTEKNILSLTKWIIFQIAIVIKNHSHFQTNSNQPRFPWFVIDQGK